LTSVGQVFDLDHAQCVLAAGDLLAGSQADDLCDDDVCGGEQG